MHESDVHRTFYTAISKQDPVPTIGFAVFYHLSKTSQIALETRGALTCAFDAGQRAAT